MYFSYWSLIVYFISLLNCCGLLSKLSWESVAIGNWICWIFWQHDSSVIDRVIRLKHNWNTTSILHWSQCHGYVSGQLKESERQSGDFYVEDMKSNESKPLSWERQTVLCWKYFKTKTWYWETLWDKVWIIRGLVFGAALSNFLFAAQTSNCFGCFCHPATSAHNNPHCPQQDPPLLSSLSLTLFCCKLL